MEDGWRLWAARERFDRRPAPADTVTITLDAKKVREFVRRRSDDAAGRWGPKWLTDALRAALRLTEDQQP